MSFGPNTILSVRQLIRLQFVEFELGIVAFGGVIRQGALLLQGIKELSERTIV